MTEIVQLAKSKGYAELQELEKQRILDDYCSDIAAFLVENGHEELHNKLNALGELLFSGEHNIEYEIMDRTLMDICFVILNYNLYVETVACVDSIKTHVDTQSFKIIIVDNASPNGSGEILKDQFAEDCLVDVILLTENLGFARGNNIGIAKAREEGATFVCCINDDAELRSDNFFSVIQEKYKEYRAAVIGPKIINREGYIDEFYHPLKTIEEYEHDLKLMKTETYRQYKKRKKYNLKYWLRQRVDRHELSRRAFQKFKIKRTGIDPYAQKPVKYSEDTLDLVLQGSCLVFTPIFFVQLSGFNDATFLYYEESFLQAELLIHSLLSLYTPAIEVYHKGGAATESIAGKKTREKWEFQKKEFCRSIELLISFLKEHQEEIYQHERGR